MLKHAADLSDSHEYFIVWTGEANARPWGTKTEGFSLFPEYQNIADGVDFTSITIGSGDHLAGTTETFAVAPTGLTVNEWANATLRLGTTTDPVKGYGTIVSNTSSTITVTWTISPGTGDIADPAGYLVRDNVPGSSYPQVRVLTPFQPVVDSATDTNVAYPTPSATTTTRSLTLPAPFSGATGATSHEDIGVFLDFSFNEGIDGYGISEAKDSKGDTAHNITHLNSAGTEFTFANAIPTGAAADDILNGGYVIIDWLDDQVSPNVMKRSWAPITDSEDTKFMVGAGTWLGDTVDASGLLEGSDTDRGTRVKHYTAWIPHYNDSPHAYLPGEGYTYPLNDMMPYGQSAIGAAVHNRPRQITGSAYGDRFGAMLIAASRLSAAIGRRVNVVNLAIDSTSIGPGNTSKIEATGFASSGSPLISHGFRGKVGWWDVGADQGLTPYLQTSHYQRLDKLLRTVLPNALKAESSTKTLRCLGISFIQGESDALSASGRQHYGQSVNMVVTAIRNLINALGYNPYANGAEIPVVHPLIPTSPFGTEAGDGSTSAAYYYGEAFTFDADTSGLVNSAIKEHTSADQFAATVTVDDLPRLATDGGHFNGVGEAELGSRIADEMGQLVDYALGHGSTALTSTQTKLVDICNLALSSIGETGSITSLDDGSEQAALCKKFLPEARDGLLQMRQWGFAVRRVVLTKINKPDAFLYQHYENCYVMPPEALNAFAVLPPVEDPTTIDTATVLGATYSATFVTNRGSYSSVADSDISIKSSVELDPVPFAVEQSPHGHRYIFSNQNNATLRYVARVVDAEQYSPHFSSALAYYLGSMLSGAIIKGDQGEAVSARLLQKTAGLVRMASSSDAIQQRPIDDLRPFGFIPDHLASR
tara:strand:+ start:298 stop:2928 length:2631 start_codon:yes stop_codon:yes gene_type:complete